MGVDNGIVFFYFRIDKLQNRLRAFQMKLHATSKLQGAAAPDPGGQAEPSPAALAQIIDGVLQSTGQIFAGVGIDTTRCGLHIMFGDHRHCDMAQDLFTQCRFLHLLILRNVR